MFIYNTNIYGQLNRTLGGIEHQKLKCPFIGIWAHFTNSKPRFSRIYYCNYSDIGSDHNNLMNQ